MDCAVGLKVRVAASPRAISGARPAIVSCECGEGPADCPPCAAAAFRTVTRSSARSAGHHSSPVQLLSAAPRLSTARAAEHVSFHVCLVERKNRPGECACSRKA
ncbi:hypothetical protein MRX96_058493 [Rhipicephalus microplus]